MKIILFIAFAFTSLCAYTQQGDSISMRKEIDSLKRVIVKKDAIIKKLNTKVKELVFISKMPALLPSQNWYPGRYATGYGRRGQ